MVSTVTWAIMASLLGLQQVLAEVSLRSRMDELRDLGEMLRKKT